MVAAAMRPELATLAPKLCASAWAHGRFRLCLEGPGLQEPLRAVLDQPFLLIGRGQKSGLALPDTRVSRRHVYVHFFEQRAYAVHVSRRRGIEDDGHSPRGQWIDDAAPMNIGPYRLHLRCVHPDEASPGAPPTLCPMLPAQNGSAPIQLHIHAPEGKSVARLLRRQLTLVGRGRPAHLQLVHPTVSQPHCVLVRGGGVLWIVDLDSRLGISTEGLEQQLLRLDDSGRVLLGDVRVEARFATAQTRPPGGGSANGYRAEVPTAARPDPPTQLDDPSRRGDGSRNGDSAQKPGNGRSIGQTTHPENGDPRPKPDSPRRQGAFQQRAAAHQRLHLLEQQCAELKALYSQAVHQNADLGKKVLELAVAVESLRDDTESHHVRAVKQIEAANDQLARLDEKFGSALSQREHVSASLEESLLQQRSQLQHLRAELQTAVKHQSQLQQPLDYSKRQADLQKRLADVVSQTEALNQSLHVLRDEAAKHQEQSNCQVKEMAEHLARLQQQGKNLATEHDQMQQHCLETQARCEQQHRQDQEAASQTHTQLRQLVQSNRQMIVQLQQQCQSLGNPSSEPNQRLDELQTFVEGHLAQIQVRLDDASMTAAEQSARIQDQFAKLQRKAAVHDLRWQRLRHRPPESDHRTIVTLPEQQEQSPDAPTDWGGEPAPAATAPEGGPDPLAELGDSPCNPEGEPDAAWHDGAPNAIKSDEILVNQWLFERVATLDRRRKHRSRKLMTALTVVLLLALSVGGVALWQSGFMKETFG